MSNALMSFSIVLIVGFWRHGLHFFSLFVPHGTPAWLLPLIPLIELISFMVRPFSLGLRLFVAMMAGHILLEGAPGPVRDAVLLNAGAALAVYDAPGQPVLDALAAGIARAGEAIDSGAAQATLDRWVEAASA